MRDIYLNVYVYDEFWAARNVKKVKFWIFQANLPQLGLFHPYFVSKSSFRVISMIKIVILDQSKPISLIFEKKIIIQKIQNLDIVRLLFAKTKIRQVYNPY